MVRPSSSDASQDVLNSIRRIVTDAAQDAGSGAGAATDAQRSAPRARTDIRALAAELAEARAIGPDVLWLGAAEAVRPPEPVGARPLPDPDFANGNFADRMTSLADRLAAPSLPPREEGFQDPKRTPTETPAQARSQIPADAPDLSKAPTPAEDADALRPCTLLLTQDFRVRTTPRAPMPQTEYVEDSDHTDGAIKTAVIPDLTSVLRDAVSQTVRESVRDALRAERPLAEAAPEQAAVEPALVDADGYITADAVRRLVSGILHEELRGALGDEITRRVRKLVRAEVHRILQTEALD